MPAVFLVRILTWFASSLAFHIFASLGIGLVTFSVISEATNAFITSFQSAVNSLPADVLNLIGLAGMDQYFSTVMGAVTMVAYLKATGIAVGKSSS